MPRKQDKTQLKIQEEIHRLDREIEERKTQLVALRRLLPEDKKPVEKPKGFKLSTALREVLKAHIGSWIFLDDAVREVTERWKHEPNRKTVQVTLNAWVRGEKIKKDETRDGYYMQE